MKNILFAITILVCSLMLPTGCKSGTNYASENEAICYTDSIKPTKLLPTEYVDGCDIYNGLKYHHLADTIKTDSPGVYIDYEIDLLESHPAITVSLISILQNTLKFYWFIPNSDTPPFSEEVAQQLLDSGHDNFVREILKYDATEFVETTQFSVNEDRHFYLSFKAYPVYADEDFITYYIYEDSYNGSRGNFDEYYLTFNLEEGTTLEFDDYTVLEDWAFISKKLVAHLAKQNDCAPEEYLNNVNEWLKTVYGGADQFSEADFARVTPAIIEQGLIFNFPRYTIAGGADGVPTVILSFDELKGAKTK